MTAAEMILTNATVITRHDELPGATVVVRDGRIAEVDDTPSTASGAIDLGGRHLLPGLVEMHTDHMEKHFMPRPGVMWPSALAAVLAHDAQVASAGITTVFDAISIGADEDKGFRRQILADSVAAVKHAQHLDVLRADHLFHMRCEVSDPCVVEMFAPYADDPLVRVVSLMDHTPGQRQWANIDAFIQYNQGEGWGEDEVRRRVSELKAEQDRYAIAHRRQIVALVAGRDLALASHDDATEAHIAEAIEEGVTIAEFPITEEAARAARAAGLKTILGAPNVVRGGSHSGNIAALELARLGLLDGLSSDYVPASLLHAAFLLRERLALSLPEAVAKVSANVAEMVGLDDRGEIAPGKRADLIVVEATDHVPVVRQVWRTGQRVV
ncbi:alpha-D-ribose 1-methylphosphonate 5-triphosphate diphosphatase [Roseospirillum parvum]|uniref:Alpha-D-ribose 1-methylphosphonate 5-triphosphate diphosphatase n=1 Tax=Roseospirillum parvum TaxID=83401 RepID=A0A1G8EST9_9PROT|nr:alpha-D-ribose 1-methylphosphonate 5-triphosphate diphosphatase [Roseospirillum parvum]SDH72953.1 alpha-D-ribose 1-methylphosphonate 5-triphosphate diphosphatase [Roseospirillum parvum]